MLAMLAKLEINEGCLKYNNEKKTKLQHLCIHSVTYAIHTNALRQKEKKKDVLEIHKVLFSVTSGV